jgi:hypothetical protein
MSELMTEEQYLNLLEKINSFDHERATPFELQALNRAMRLVSQYALEKAKEEKATKPHASSKGESDDLFEAMAGYAEEVFERTLDMVRRRMVMATPLGAYEEIAPTSLWQEFCYARQVGPYTDVKFADNRRGKDWTAVISRLAREEAKQVPDRLKPVLDIFSEHRVKFKSDKKLTAPFVQLLFEHIRQQALDANIAQLKRAVVPDHRATETYVDDGIAWRFLTTNSEDQDFQEDLLKRLSRSRPDFDQISFHVSKQFLEALVQEYPDTVIAELVECLAEDLVSLIADADVSDTLRNLHRQLRNELDQRDDD